MLIALVRRDVYVEATSQRVRSLTPLHSPEHVVSQGAGSAVDQRGQACCRRQREGSSMTWSRSAHAFCIRAVMAMYTAWRVSSTDVHFEKFPVSRDVGPVACDRFKCSGVCARSLSRRNLHCCRCALWLSQTPFPLFGMPHPLRLHSYAVSFPAQANKGSTFGRREALQITPVIAGVSAGPGRVPGGAGGGGAQVPGRAAC